MSGTVEAWAAYRAQAGERHLGTVVVGSVRDLHPPFHQTAVEAHRSTGGVTFAVGVVEGVPAGGALDPARGEGLHEDPAELRSGGERGA